MSGGKAKSIITGSLVITAVIGVLNSLYKKNSLPGFRFFMGSGVLYLFLTFLADFEPEIAQSIAIAIVTLTTLSEGGETLDHFMGKGTAKGTLNTAPASRGNAGVNDVGGFQGSTTLESAPRAVIQTRKDNAITTTVAPTGTAPIKPVIPNLQVF